MALNARFIRSTVPGVGFLSVAIMIGCPNSMSDPTSSEKPQDRELAMLMTRPFKSKTANAVVVPGSTPTIVYVLFVGSWGPLFCRVFEIAPHLQRVSSQILANLQMLCSSLRVVLCMLQDLLFVLLLDIFWKNRMICCLRLYGAGHLRWDVTRVPIAANQ